MPRESGLRRAAGAKRASGKRGLDAYERAMRALAPPSDYLVAGEAPKDLPVRVVPTAVAESELATLRGLPNVQVDNVDLKWQRWKLVVVRHADAYSPLRGRPGHEMVVVPAGTFLMGSPPDEEGREDDEGPQHVVTIVRPFAVGVYEVTVSEWDACTAAGGCESLPDHGPRDEDRRRLPAYGLSWHDADSYVRWLSVKTGEHYRLPSEAEWEYFARAGTTTPYHTGWTISMAQANYDGTFTYGAARDGGYYRDAVAPVGSFAPNRWGVHDVHGNVEEWVQDCYHDSYASASLDGKARKDDCARRVQRGGRWDSLPQRIRASSRAPAHVDNRRPNVGFRVVRTIASPADPAAAPSMVLAHDAEATIDGTGAVAVRKPSRSLADAADADVLALRVLHYEMLEDYVQGEVFDLLPDEARLAELSSELADVLPRLKAAYPEFARFHVRSGRFPHRRASTNAFGLLSVGFYDEFAPVVQDVVQAATNVRGDRFDGPTGHVAFDRLNERMGLRHIDVREGLGDVWFTLHLHENANLDIAVRLYSAIDVVEWVHPVESFLDGSDIDAHPTAEGWEIFIFNRWGDCPSGCINKETFRFEVRGESIKRVHVEGEPESPSLPYY